MGIAATWSAQLKDVWANGVLDNPVVSKELRTRMRGRKGFMVMGGYVLLLSVVLLIAYYTMWIISARNMGGMSTLVNVKLGLKLFEVLNWTQTILLALIIPSLTSGALTMELEKKTIEMLVLTRLTPGTVVLGKHLTGMLYSLILLLCSLPLSGICLMFGGISPAEMVVTYMLLIAWTFILSAIGVFWSSLFNRTAAAVLMTYGVIAAHTLSSAGSGAALMQPLWYGGGPANVNAMTLLNPGWAPWGALMKATVCGIALPIFLPPLVEYIVFGSALLFIAAMHVKYLKAEKALPARVLLIGSMLLFIWLTYGDRSYTVGNKELITWMTAMIFVAAGLFVPLFATGQMPKTGDRLNISHFLDPRKAFKSDLGGAFCFVMLAAVLMLATFVITINWASLVTHVKVTATEWGSIMKIGVSALAVIAAMAAVSIFASAITKMRRNAVVIAFLAIVIMFAGYGIVLANYSLMLSHARNPIWQLAAFWPVTPLVTTMGDWHSGMPALWWPKQLSWLVVGAIYAALTLALLLAAPKLAQKFGGVEEEQY